MIRQWLISRELRRQRAWAADRPRLDALYAARLDQIARLGR